MSDSEIVRGFLASTQPLDPLERIAGGGGGGGAGSSFTGSVVGVAIAGGEGLP